MGFSVHLHGLRIGFRVDRDSGLVGLRKLLGSSAALPGDEAEVDLLYSYRVGGRRGRRQDYHLLYQGSRPLARSLHWADLIEPLRRDVSAALGLNSPDFVSLLGTAVSHRQRGVLILGPLGSGRSTLAESLCQQGAQPMDDSIVLLDRQAGLLRPVWSQTPACPVSTVVVTEYRENRNFRPRRLAPARAALELFARAPGASLQPGLVLPVLARLCQQVPVLKGVRGEAGQTAQRLLRLA